MKKLIVLLTIAVSLTVSAQTLFYYGTDSISVKEFIRAFTKNNTGVKSEKSLSDYLHLYINSRLKIKEAKEKGYDTLGQLVTDLNNLRQQILPSYLNDKKSLNKLVDEAFLRSLKDIHLAHIFISFQHSGTTDSVFAQNELKEVQEQLKQNISFSSIARKYSDDPSAKVNGGDIGYITVFTLPYELENLAYSTHVGKYSAVYRSKAGFHILKNLGERKDPGKIKAAQILLAFPPGSDEGTIMHIKKLGDSLYSRLQKGDDFASLAATFSNDPISASANGQMQEFGIGQYDPEFENAVYGLHPEGAVSKPFLTAHGIHIVKLIKKIPLVDSKSDARALQALKDKVLISDRMKATRSSLAHRILIDAGFRKYPFLEAEVWAYTDSVLNYVKPRQPLKITSNSELFKLGEKKQKVADWVSYVQTYRYRSDGSGIKPYNQLWDEFVEAKAIEYFQEHLENFNPDFRQQLAEFKEGNLFFEIMQRQVWAPAQSDTSAIITYYNKNRNKYNWNHSADAVVFYASDASTAKTFRDQLQKSPASWHSLITGFSEKVAADSARFELSQLGNPSKSDFQEGDISSIAINSADKTASFAYILHIYNKPAPKSFNEARGLVINDFQTELENQWVKELMKKYPVRINEKVYRQLIKDERLKN